MAARIGRRAVDKLQPGEWVHDDLVRGFSARRLPSGRVQYQLRYVGPDGRRRAVPLGLDGETTPEDARKAAASYRTRVTLGGDPKAEREAEERRTSETVAVVSRRFIEKVAKPRLRSWEEIERIIEANIVPEIGNVPMTELKRADVMRLLDKVAANGADRMADLVLAWLRRVCNWYAAGTDDFNSPIVRGMARTKQRERARTRALTAPEIAALWKATEATEPECFGAFVRMLLLTAQRRSEVAKMAWAEIDGDAWTIPAERYKTGVANVVPLSNAALAILTGIKRRGTFVFSTDKGKTALGGFSKGKRAVDRAMLAALKEAAKAEGRSPKKVALAHWTIHDLRRSAKTMMAASGVRPEVSERVLGHVIRGVEGVYDRHHYEPEKRAALEALAQRVAIIVEGKGATILDIAQRRAANAAA